MDEMKAAMFRDMNRSINGLEPSWTAIDAVLLFVMWSAMMAAMMVPGGSPMVVAFATINHRRRQRDAPHVPTTIFLLGYLIIWAGFSVIATALQWLLQATGLLTTMMQSASYLLVSRAVRRRRSLPIQPAQENVSRPLPLASRLRSQRVARWRARRRDHGPTAWIFLHGLLRGTDGAAVCRRDHGFALGRGFDSSGDCRKDSARSKTLQAWDRCRFNGDRRGLSTSGLERGLTHHAAGVRAAMSEFMLCAVFRMLANTGETSVQCSTW